jgi:hypothetical protein
MTFNRTVVMPGRKLKFPAPNDYPAITPVVLCPADRVIGLYNQETGGNAKRIAKKLRIWFSAEAVRNGWALCKYVPEVQSKHGAGCLLLNSPQVQINVNRVIINFPDENE